MLNIVEKPCKIIIFHGNGLGGLAADSATNMRLLALVLFSLDSNNVRFVALYWKWRKIHSKSMFFKKSSIFLQPRLGWDKPKTFTKPHVQICYTYAYF